MQNINYTITFYGYWHAGGKDGANATLDNAVLKDDNNNPYIGGKTIKGLVRDAAGFIKEHQLKLIDTDFINTIFGKEDEDYKGKTEGRIENKFNSATPEFIIPSDLAPYLYHKKTSTAITDNKQAKEHSLRTSELTIPMVLHGSIENFTGNKDDLAKCFQSIKLLGENRYRGIGRCEFKIKESNKEAVNV